MVGFKIRLAKTSDTLVILNVYNPYIEKPISFEYALLTLK